MIFTLNYEKNFLKSFNNTGNWENERTQATFLCNQITNKKHNIFSDDNKLKLMFVYDENERLDIKSNDNKMKYK